MGWIEDIHTGQLLGERHEREEVFSLRGRHPDPYAEPFYLPHRQLRRTRAQRLRESAAVDMECAKIALRHGRIEIAFRYLGQYVEQMNEARRRDAEECTPAREMDELAD